jgi:non-ribosomal peptide synthetase component E (peptide arylation enzyme)
MSVLGRTKQVVEDAGEKIAAATEVARTSINLSLLLAGAAILIAAVALVVAVVK